MPLHWWLRPKEEQERLLKDQRRTLERQAEVDRVHRREARRAQEALAEVDLARRREVAEREERQREAERRARCPLCHGSGRAMQRVGVSAGMPDFRMARCPCGAGG